MRHAQLTDRIARALVAADPTETTQIRVAGTAAADLARAVIRLAINDGRPDNLNAADVDDKVADAVMVRIAQALIRSTDQSLVVLE
jgi:hypothetical protein